MSHSTPIISFTGGYVATNGYVIDTENACLVIDAPALIHQMIKTEKFKPTHLLLTHQHFDHTEDVEKLQALGIKVIMHSPYDEALIRQKEARENWGFPVQIKPFEADQLIAGDEMITVGDLEFNISHVPGHSPDSVTFYSESLGVVFVGDTLLAGGMGRTDLPGGSYEQLVSGIKKHLYKLPDETLVLSGHGQPTTIGNEKKHNDFL